MKKSNNYIPNLMWNVDAIKNPIQYQWNDDILEKFSFTRGVHADLRLAVCKISYKATIGLTAMLCEYVFTRLYGSPELTQPMLQDINNRIEALWAAAIDPKYSKTIPYDDDDRVPDYFIEGHIYGPAWLTLTTIRDITECCNYQSYYIHTTIIGLILMVEYIAPDKEQFKKWFTELLKNTTHIFPCSYDYNDINPSSVYDSSRELPIPREYFTDPGFCYTPKDAEQKIKSFLQSLDFEQNIYLRSPEEMLKIGFVGSPYEN